jgi:hypothetical protein
MNQDKKIEAGSAVKRSLRIARMRGDIVYCTYCKQELPSRKLTPIQEEKTMTVSRKRSSVRFAISIATFSALLVAAPLHTTVGAVVGLEEEEPLKLEGVTITGTQDYTGNSDFASWPEFWLPPEAFGGLAPEETAKKNRKPLAKVMFAALMGRTPT